MPFSLSILLQSHTKKLHKIIVLVIAIGIFSALLLTDSRNAWGGLMLSIPFVLGPARWFWLLPLLFFLYISLLKNLLSIPELQRRRRWVLNSFI